MKECPGNHPWLTCPPTLTYEGYKAQSYGCSRCGLRVTKNELRDGTRILSSDELRIEELEAQIAGLNA